MIMHYTEGRPARGDNVSVLETNLIITLNCPPLRHNKQSDKKWRHKTIVKTMPRPDLRLSVSQF